MSVPWFPFLSPGATRFPERMSAKMKVSELREALPLKTLREAIVALDPMDEGEEDPWDRSDEECEDAEET